jgi:hypothetical protein
MNDIVSRKLYPVNMASYVISGLPPAYLTISNLTGLFSITQSNHSTSLVSRDLPIVSKSIALADYSLTSRRWRK